MDVTSHTGATGLADALPPAAAFTYSSALFPASAIAGIILQVMAIVYLISRSEVESRESIWFR